MNEWVDGWIKPLSQFNLPSSSCFSFKLLKKKYLYLSPCLNFFIHYPLQADFYPLPSTKFHSSRLLRSHHQEILWSFFSSSLPCLFCSVHFWIPIPFEIPYALNLHYITSTWVFSNIFDHFSIFLFQAELSLHRHQMSEFLKAQAYN